MTFHLSSRPVRALLSVASAGTIIVLAPTLARAQNVVFADFTQQDPTQRLFSKVGDLLSATDAPVFFRFSVNNGYGARNVFISARLNFSATFTGPITSGSGNNAVQVLNNITAVFTADVPGLNGSTNLLNMTDSTGQFNVGGQAGGENSATDGGNAVNFSSAALNFSSTASRNTSFSFASITPSVDSATAVANQVIPNFTTAGGGQFASTPAPLSTTVVPEASTLALALPALSTIGALVIRRRLSALRKK